MLLLVLVLSSKLTNTSDGYITLTSSLGNYMLDVSNGDNGNNVNIQVYDAYAGDPQKFVVLKNNKINGYVIGTKVSNGDKVIDVEKKGTTDGSNVLQYSNNEQSNQTWIFESTSAPANPTPAQTSQSSAPAQTQASEATCWSTKLGYSCCKTCSVFFTDNDGKWGIENNNWCGIPSTCTSTCTGAQGYPCCSSTCEVYSSDSDGKWGIENNDWCLIDSKKC